MAIRYCGRLRLSIRCTDTGGMSRRPEYTVNISEGGRRLKAVSCSLSWDDSRRLAVDSPEAIDKIAHSAVSFASADVREHAEDHPSGAGWLIRRKK